MRSTTVSNDAFAPIGGINTTPLIDVMLVLLVMFIIIIPAVTHKVPLDLPTPGGTSAPAPVHRLDMDAAGALHWDGQSVSRTDLTQRLVAMRSDPAGPVLHMKMDAATPYALFDETLSVVKKAGITKLGFVGNDAFAKAID